MTAGPRALKRFPPVETHRIVSTHVGDTFEIHVALPPSEPGCQELYPVLYAGDANLTFDLFKGIAYLLQTSGECVPFILVGVGYPSASPLGGALLRARDFTFPGYPRVALIAPPYDDVLVASPDARAYFGADQFRRFLADELFPLVEQLVPALPTERIYFGHSGGGGFGLFDLFAREPLFKRYLISSPGLTFNGVDGAGVQYDDHDFMLEEIRRFAARGAVIDDTHLFVSVGGCEDDEPALRQWRLTSGFHRLRQLLDELAIPNLTVTSDLIAAETHMSVWPVAFMHGVKAMLGPDAMSGAQS